MPDSPWIPWPDLNAMMERAINQNLWFHCCYQDLWFSPSELQAAWTEGRFRWGAVNWTLRNPSERRAELAAEREAKDRELEDFESRVRREDARP